MTPLRAKMIKGMRVRGFSVRTHESYLYAVTDLARYYHRAPGQLGIPRCAKSIGCRITAKATEHMTSSPQWR